MQAEDYLEADTVRTLLARAYAESAQVESQSSFTAAKLPDEDIRRMQKLSAGQDQLAWTNGEITFEGALRLGELLGVGPDDVFYDLGSGYGRLTLQAHLQWGVQRSVGVELSRERHNRALEAKGNLQPYLDTARPVDIINANLLECDLSDATCVYMSSTCWNDVFMTQVLRMLEQGAPALKWAVSTEPLERKFGLKPAWLPLDRMERVPQSWAPEGYPLYIYKRVGGVPTMHK